ncbi:hypothetical protein GGTG_02240 [Gaeumannomyces tritici R3-111a-1]|uniref:Uncharacterized protein n=1 Tax=Gaeumannomyces tritici (strain R3-111a-1) TaxID=644352 RepID=J3NLU0_GAET3|nr:hypothetical protein GGTG_02240 [Gaeumannomyces tritici R3-111a-1]EJT82266.1 hypothetical protein GGTG_02240 [Gaeumannomyces tritici R3-111a-1]
MDQAWSRTDRHAPGARDNTPTPAKGEVPHSNSPSPAGQAYHCHPWHHRQAAELAPNRARCVLQPHEKEMVDKSGTSSTSVFSAPPPTLAGGKYNTWGAVAGGGKKQEQRVKWGTTGKRDKSS